MSQARDPLQRRRDHWCSTRRLTAWLLAGWFIVSFCVIFFARGLNAVVIFGWPLSFYMAAQGTILVYVAIVGFYAWRMQAIDRRFDAAGETAPQAAHAREDKNVRDDPHARGSQAPQEFCPVGKKAGDGD